MQSFLFKLNAADNSSTAHVHNNNLIATGAARDHDGQFVAFKQDIANFCAFGHLKFNGAKALG